MGVIHPALDHMLSVRSSLSPPGNGVSILFYLTCPQFVPTSSRAKEHIICVSTGLERNGCCFRPNLGSSFAAPRDHPWLGWARLWTLGLVANLQAMGLAGYLLTPWVGDGREDVQVGPCLQQTHTRSRRPD